MKIKYNKHDNMYTVWEGETLLLEIGVDRPALQLEVAHYGHHETVVGVYYEANAPEMKVEILKRPNKAYEQVVITTSMPITAWEHLE